MRAYPRHLCAALIAVHRRAWRTVAPLGETGITIGRGSHGGLVDHCYEAASAGDPRALFTLATLAREVPHAEREFARLREQAKRSHGGQARAKQARQRLAEHWSHEVFQLAYEELRRHHARPSRGQLAKKACALAVRFGHPPAECDWITEYRARQWLERAQEPPI
jgi:hypothetical protein